MRVKLLFVLFLLSFSFAVAAPQIIMDSSHNFGETVLGVVQMGENVELLSSDLNFDFKKGRKDITMTHDILSYEGNYYFYIYL